MLQITNGQNVAGSSDVQALTGYTPEEDDANVSRDGVHRQRIPMTFHVGGYPATQATRHLKNRQYHERMSTKGVPFPLEIGGDRFPTVRRLNKSVEDGAKRLMASAGLPNTTIVRMMVTAYLADLVGEGNALADWVAEEWRDNAARNDLIVAHGIVSRALAGLGIGIQFPKLVDLVN